MGTINDIKSIFIGLSAYQQEQVLDDLLQEHEVQGKVIDLAIDELKQERNKKHVRFAKVIKFIKEVNKMEFRCINVELKIVKNGIVKQQEHLFGI